MFRFLKRYKKDIETKTTIQRLENEVKQKDNMIDALDQNKIMLEEKVFTRDAEIHDLKAHIEEMKPSGSVALEYDKNGLKEFKWASPLMYMSKNFRLSEFMENDDLEYIKLDSNLVLALQDLRNSFNKSIKINSGYRSPAYNKAIGGASKSQHLSGNAADIVVSGKNASTVQNFVKEHYRELGIGGLGIYKSFTHIDTRPLKDGKLTIWNG